MVVVNWVSWMSKHLINNLLISAHRQWAGIILRWLQCSQSLADKSRLCQVNDRTCFQAGYSEKQGSNRNRKP